MSEFQVQYVEYMPEQKEQGVLYLSHRFRTAIHLCACGCGYETVTPFSMWDIWTNDEGAVTMHPSIGNFSFACMSHYWIRDGKIVWT